MPQQAFDWCDDLQDVFCDENGVFQDNDCFCCKGVSAVGFGDGGGGNGGNGSNQQVCPFPVDALAGSGGSGGIGGSAVELVSDAWITEPSWESPEWFNWVMNAAMLSIVIALILRIVSAFADAEE